MGNKMRLRNIQTNIEHQIDGTGDITIGGIPAIVNGHVTDKFSIVEARPAIDIHKYKDVFYDRIKDNLMMVTEEELLALDRKELKAYVSMVHAGNHVNVHRSEVNIIRQLLVIRDKIIKLRHIEVQ